MMSQTVTVSTMECDKAPNTAESGQNMDLDKLTEIFDDFSKVLGKFRKYRLAMVSGTKSPQILELSSLPSLPAEETKTPEREESVKEFLTNPRNKAWGSNFIENAFRYKVADKFRSDRLNNYYVADPEQRTGWRSVHDKVFKQFWNSTEAFIFECQDAVRECDGCLDVFNERFECKIRPNKWMRSSFITKTPVTLKEFVNFCRNEHKRLPKLR